MPTTEKTNGAELTTWSPLTDLLDWNGRVAQFLENRWPHHLAPGAELDETDDEYLLEFDLPGVDKKDVIVDVTGRRVAVHGTRADKERAGVLRYSTRTTGDFAYEIRLPSPVDEERVTATLDGGVLSVRIPKASNAKTTRVEIA